MNVGQMTSKVIIKHNVGTTQDSFGAGVESWATLATVWGQVVWVSGQKRFLFEKAVTVQAGTVKIHWRSDVNETMLLEVDGKDYKIVGIKPLGLNFRETLELTIERVE